MKFKNSQVWLILLLLFFFGGLKSTAQYYKIDTSFHFEDSLIAYVNKNNANELTYGYDKLDKQSNGRFTIGGQTSSYRRFIIGIDSSGVVKRHVFVPGKEALESYDELLYSKLFNELIIFSNTEFKVTREFNADILSINNGSQQFLEKKNDTIYLQNYDSTILPINLSDALNFKISAYDIFLITDKNQITQLTSKSSSESLYFRTILVKGDSIISKPLGLNCSHYSCEFEVLNLGIGTIGIIKKANLGYSYNLYIKNLLGDDVIDLSGYYWSKLIGKEDSNIYVKTKDCNFCNYEYLCFNLVDGTSSKLNIQGDFDRIQLLVNDVYAINRSKIYKFIPTSEHISHNFPDSIYVNDHIDLNDYVSPIDEQIQFSLRYNQYLDGNIFKPEQASTYAIEMKTASGLSAISNIKVIRRQDSIIAESDTIHFYEMPMVKYFYSANGLPVNVIAESSANSVRDDLGQVDSVLIANTFFYFTWSEPLAFRYTLRSIGNNEFSPAQKKISVIVLPASLTKDRWGNSEEILLFPNPVINNEFKVAIAAEDYNRTNHFKVFDSQGKTIPISFSTGGSFNTYRILLPNNLSLGKYTLEIIGYNGIRWTKSFFFR